ncbi:PREDICTED: uncharacterized protein LOC104736941 [Camelina sativa]|uniref:Uncharacterized protein LOC104736941 n=1 Tax=Camelina sativa TaxID=90675 RepID=A0ABM0VFC9_CAMSA|nr:PREDICTED: uncharacterized protein LOC104736941 [Camelina sativa]
MKSEGRHQRIVRTGMIHPQGFNPRPTNRLYSARANGVFIKMPSDTTNHSNFTGESELSNSKYSNCHVSPIIKSSHKSKGSRKIQPTSWWSEDKLDRLIGTDSSSVKEILDTLWDEEHDEH